MDTYERFLQLSHQNLFKKDLKRAIVYANIAQTIRDDDHRLYDILAEAYMLTEEYDRSIEAGRESLILKDRLTSKYGSISLPAKPIKPFDRSKREHNIISFSLFGDNHIYLMGALENAKVAKDIYPHWCCRFYCDRSVPLDTISKLQELDSQIIIRDTTDIRDEMLLWRFEVMSDKTIDRYIIRDCDSILNQKESVAVSEWIESNRRFHVMRDFYTHTDLILAGMFGGVTDVFSDIRSLIDRFHKIKEPNISHQDQLFLRVFVWQTIKQDLLVHDSLFGLDDSYPFPQYTIEGREGHIGERVYVTNSNQN
jgi:hypothetical protein